MKHLSFRPAGIFSTFILAIVCTTLQGQFQNGGTPKVWYQSTAVTHQYPDSTLHFIGNHPVPPVSGVEVQQKLKKISGFRAGTVYLVMRLTKPVADTRELLRMGCVSVYNRETSVCGRINGHAPLDTQTRVLRIQFQKSYLRAMRSDVYIDTALQIGEVLYFADEHQEEAWQTVESYLALKYSVNITTEAGGGYRRYLDNKERTAWNVEGDKNYSEQILALGHLSKIQFFQTQTYPADSKEISISAAKKPQRGTSQPVDIKDGSLMVWSQKEISSQPIEAACGLLGALKYWKIHLMDWHSSMDSVTVTLDTAFSPQLKPVLQAQGKIFAVRRKKSSASTEILRVPLPREITEGTMYLAWTKPRPKDCDSKLGLQVLACGENSLKKGATMPNGLRLHYTADNPGNLRIRLTRQTRQRAGTKPYHLDTVIPPQSELTHLPGGHYEVVIHDGQGALLADTLLVLPDCGENNTGTLAQINAQDQGNSQGGGVEPPDDSSENSNGDAHFNNQPFLSVYPVPAQRQEEVILEFHRFAPGEVHIDVLDTRGRLLRRYSDFISAARYQKPLSFAIDGIYLLRIHTPDFKTEKKVIIR